MDLNELRDFLAQNLGNYEVMKPYLSMKVIGQEDNQDLLSNVPHTKIEDMAAIYHFDMLSTPEGNATVKITNNMMAHYGITTEQLHQDATEQTRMKQPAVISTMGEVMSEMTGMDMTYMAPPFYVATNETKMNGAAIIAYPNFMEDAAAKLEESFYVLPSSKHEVLLIPDSMDMKANELKAMVTEINGTEVLPEDRLTNNVYHYDSVGKVFEQAEKFEKRQKEKTSVLGELSSKKMECAMKEPKEKKVKREEVAL